MGLNVAIAILLFPTWVYLVGATVALRRFVARALPEPPHRPPVSVLKPLHGEEPGLYENLRSFAEQCYPSVQIVLGVRDPLDTALPAACALIRDLSGNDIALVVDARANGSNLKIANLENMIEAARATMISAEARRESRGAHDRADYHDQPDYPNGRNDKEWLKHTLWYKAGDRLDYKSVILKPLTAETIAPKARAY